MFGRTALLAGALALCVAAESFKPTKIHNVTVSKEKGKFVPNNTMADPGDIIQFQFYPTNHSVVRAAYGNSCVPIETVQPDATGFYSGHFIITDPAAPPPTWNLTVNDTNPVYFYCTAVDSCIGEGMIGAINAPDLEHIQSQFDDARQAPFMLEPGQAARQTATSTPASSTPTAAPSPSSSSNSSHNGGGGGGGLPGGAIAGIVIGALVIVALLVAVFWLLGRHKGILAASKAGGSSAPGNFRDERTEQWAAGSAYDGNAKSEMAYSNATRTPFSEPASAGYAGFAAPSHNANAAGWAAGHSATASGAPVMSSTVRTFEPEPMELSAEHVTELEAPHVLKS